MDSYEANIPEMLIAMNVGKQAISFGFGFEVIDWIIEKGYITMFAGIFCGVMVANNLVVFIFLVFGKSMRRYLGQTRLGKTHKNSVT
jgi:polyferredoxin